MIPALVFSRNRPMQLEALLSSLEANARTANFFTTVLFRADTDEFQHAYNVCAGEHPTVGFLGEVDFEKQVIAWLPEDGAVCFFCDDDIMYRPLPQLPSVFGGDLAAFSLRLGANTTRCYPHDRDQTVPDNFGYARDDDSAALWDWTVADGDFGYPFSLDGHVMLATDVLALVKHSAFTDPNEMEAAMAYRAQVHNHARPVLASFGVSHLVGVPANRVSATHRNRAMDAPAYTPEALNEMFMDGWRIDWRALDYSGVNAAHCELTFTFKKDLQ